MSRFASRRFLFFLLIGSWLNVCIATAQTPDISGMWHLTIPGSDDTLVIEQQNENITLHLYELTRTVTYRGAIRGSELQLESPIDNIDGTASQRACIEYVRNNITRYPEYKKTMKLRIEEGKQSIMIGQVTSPAISCVSGEVRRINITTQKAKAWRPNWAYWTTGNSIMRSRIDKDKVETVITGLQNPKSIALNNGASRLYWCEESSVHSINADGTDRKRISTTSEPVFKPQNLVVDAGETTLFWVERNSIFSYTLGTNWNRHKLVEDPYFPTKLTLDNVNEKIYWISQKKIKRDNFKGGNTEDFATADASSIAVDAKGGYLYWSGGTTITRINLDNAGSPRVVVSGLALPTDLFWDVELERLYWYELGTQKIKWTSADENYGVKKSAFDLGGTPQGLVISTRASATQRQADQDEKFNIWTLLGTGQ